MTLVRRYTFVAVMSLLVTVAALALAMGTGGGASASTAPAVYVDPPTQTVSPGATFTVTIQQDSLVPTLGAGFYLHFDPTQLQILTIARGSMYTGSSLLAGSSIAEANTTGTLPAVAVYWAPGSTPTAPGQIPVPAGIQAVIVLHMQATSGASGSSDITLTEIELSDQSYVKQSGVTTTAGTVNVDNPAVPTRTNTATITPTVTETATATGTTTPTPSGSETATSTATATSTPTSTATSTATGTTTGTTTTTATTTTTTTATTTATRTATASPSATATVIAKTGAVAVGPASLTVPPDSEFTVYVNQTASFVTLGTQTDFKFNPQLVQLTSVEKAPSFGTASFSAGTYLVSASRNQRLDEAIAEANTTGTLKQVSAYYLPGSGQIAPGDNSFLTIKMKSVAEGTSDLTLDRVQLLDTDGNGVDITGTNGQVTIQLGAPTQVPPTPAVAATITPKAGSTGSSSVAGASRGVAGTSATPKALPRTGDGAGARGRFLLLVALAGAISTVASGGLALSAWWRPRRNA